MEDLQEILDQLLPGDIILDRGNNYIASAISYFDTSPYTHSLIYAGGNEVIHATRLGVEVKPIVDAFIYSKYFQVFRLIDNKISLNKVIDNAKRFEGRSYGTDQIILLALLLASSRVAYTLKVGAFARAIFEKASLLLLSYRDDETCVICSELVYRSFTEVLGKNTLVIDRGFEKAEDTVNLVKEFKCYDAWLASLNKVKSNIEIESEVKLLFKTLKEEGRQLEFTINQNGKQTIPLKKETLNARKKFMEICDKIKTKEIKFQKNKITPFKGVQNSFLSFMEANSNFVTPGDLFRSPSLKPVFDTPISLNKG